MRSEVLRRALLAVLWSCFAGVLAAAVPARASFIGDTIFVDRITQSGLWSPYSYCQDTLSLPGPCEVEVAAGVSDRIPLSGSNNLFVDVEESSIRIDFGPGSGSGGLTDIQLIVFEDLDWIGEPRFISGFTLSTDLPGMGVSRISFSEDSVSVDYSALNYPGGQFLDIFLETTLVPEPGTALLLGVGLAALALRRRLSA